MGALGTLLIFGSIIVFHEFGHFIIAKLTGMTVHEFSIGFGPAIFKRQIGETLYALRALPLGGFVRIAGMEPGETDHPKGFDKKPFLSKFGAILAGSTMNFVLALLVFIVMGLTVGYKEYTKEPVIGTVSEKSPAQTAGLVKGDRIIAIDGKPVETWDNAVKIIRAGTTKTAAMTIARDGVQKSITLTPKSMEFPERHGLRIKLTPTRVVGIEPDGFFERQSPIQSVVIGVKQVYESTMMVVASLVSLIMRDIPVSGLSGPPTIFRLANEAGNKALLSPQDTANFFALFAFLSINIGFFNLLPIPALDGGHLFVMVIEAVRRKPFDREKLAIVHAVGLLLLLSLILLISVREIWQWIYPR